MRLLILLFIISSLLLSGYTDVSSEKEYRRTIDSLSFYLQKSSFSSGGKPLSLITHYHPTNYDAMDEAYSDGLYKSRCEGRKSCVILFDNNLLCILDFKKIDTSFLFKGRNYLGIKDPNKKMDFIYSSIAREYNGRGGRLEKEIQIYPKENPESQNTFQKLQFFLSKAILLSKKVK